MVPATAKPLKHNDEDRQPQSRGRSFSSADRRSSALYPRSVSSIDLPQKGADRVSPSSSVSKSTLHKRRESNGSKSSHKLVHNILTRLKGSDHDMTGLAAAHSPYDEGSSASPSPSPSPPLIPTPTASLLRPANYPTVRVVCSSCSLSPPLFLLLVTSLFLSLSLIYIHTLSLLLVISLFTPCVLVVPHAVLW